jgi:NAD(P)-dependent dehydrogenase (short-subunit alcohol dehydrogenase family)
MQKAGMLVGRTVFITGASRGIGKAIALRAAQDGANIVIAAKTADPHPKLPGTIYTAAKEIESAGGKCLPCIVDIRYEDQVAKAVQEAVDTFGGIDILVNNASAISLTGTADTSMKKFDLMMGVNARGTFLVSKLCLPYLEKSPNPHILNISPPLNMQAVWFQYHCAYTMAKYGMSMCALGMTEEFRPLGIAVNALWPQTGIATAAIEMLGGDVALKMSRKPEIMADAAFAIITKNSKEFTGNFLIDEDLLRQEGVKNFDQYAHCPGEELLPDYFIGDGASYKMLHETVGDNRTTDSGTGQGAKDTPKDVFDGIRPLISSNVVQEVKGSFLFKLKGADSGEWFLDLKNNDGSVGPSSEGQEADVTMTMDSEDMVKMFKGEIKPTVAFMTGKLKITGNMAIAMKLEKLMGQLNSKL